MFHIGDTVRVSSKSHDGEYGTIVGTSDGLFIVDLDDGGTLYLEAGQLDHYPPKEEA